MFLFTTRVNLLGLRYNILMIGTVSVSYSKQQVREQVSVYNIMFAYIARYKYTAARSERALRDRRDVGHTLLKSRTATMLSRNIDYKHVQMCVSTRPSL